MKTVVLLHFSLALLASCGRQAAEETDPMAEIPLTRFTDHECADTGPGMPEEVRQNIFKPFFTTKAPGEGTGLGLYICHQTVEKHRGSIEVGSEVGKGTVFRVRLPAS